jgi:hypothetical protein
LSREITEAYGEGFDAEREALEIYGDLTFLNLSGKNSEGVNTYSEVERFGRNWLPEAKRGADGRAYTNLQIADVSDELRDLVDGTGGTPRTTHYAFGGIVRSVERDTILRPVSEPFIWELRGYETQDAYE